MWCHLGASPPAQGEERSRKKRLGSLESGTKGKKPSAFLLRSIRLQPCVLYLPFSDTDQKPLRRREVEKCCYRDVSSLKAVPLKAELSSLDCHKRTSHSLGGGGGGEREGVRRVGLSIDLLELSPALLSVRIES